MENCVKILILEHDQNDIDLLQYELKKSGLNYVSKIVQTKEDFESAISEFCPEVILSDYSLPSFDGLSAFQIRHALSPETPFIIVSGTIGEENAVELIKKGVTDYALKEKIYGIGPKIKRALAEARDRRQKAIAEQQLKQSREELQKILDQSLDVICTFDQEGRFIKVGAASSQVLGYQPEELQGREYKDFVYPEDLEQTVKIADDIIKGLEITNFENRYVRKDGRIVPLIWSMRWDANDQLMYSIARDATKVKIAEEKIKNNEKRFRALLQNSNDGLVLVAADGTLLEISSTGRRILKIDTEGVLSKIQGDFIHSEDLPKISEAFMDVLVDPDNVRTTEIRYFTPDGSYRWIESSFHNQLKEPSVGAIVVNFRDVTDRKLAEISIRESEEKYRSLFHLSPIPMWVFDLDTYCFLNVNEAAIKHYGYSRDEFMAMTIKDIRPQEEIKNLDKIIKSLQENSGFFRSVTRHIKKNGEIIHVDIQGNPIQFDSKKARLILATDISDRINYIQAIEEQNARMRQIAWEQSHTVRAPLARIMGLIHLLDSSLPEEKEYDDTLRHIQTSAIELDNIIRGIVKKTEKVS